MDNTAMAEGTTKAYIQHRKSFEIKVAKNNEGKWTQRVDIKLTKDDSTELLINLDKYKEDDDYYIFPVLMYANSYLGDNPSPNCEIRYFYNYSSVPADEEKILTDYKDVSQDTAFSRDNSATTIYCQSIPLPEDTPFKIEEVQ